MKHILCILLLVAGVAGQCQELFAFTEPASNMPTGSVGVRLNNYVMQERYTTGTNYHLVPELMLGVSKKLMLHADAFVSNRSTKLVTEGGSLYGKYRFYSNDAVQRHFRLAAFARYSFNNSDIHQQEINLNGHNSGYEGGLIATQLLHKLALSSGVSYVQATNNGGGNKYPTANNKAISHTLSAGKLLLPKAYKTYRQVNVNAMLEVLSQYNTTSGKYYIDAAPSVQFIFNSVARVDVGYRRQLSSTFYRTAPNGLLLRLEYNFFNAF